MGEVVDFLEEVEEPPMDCPICGGHRVKPEVREILTLHGVVASVRLVPCEHCRGTGRG